MKNRNTPTFLLIGAMKSGTTSLHNILKQHPQIYCSPVKETKFFSNDEIYARGLEWYLDSYFADSNPFPARGESDPHYLHWGEVVVPRLAESFPGAPLKFVVILRDPVSRAYSHYWHQVRKGREPLDFEQALAAEQERLHSHWRMLRSEGMTLYGYFYGSCYMSRLRPFLEAFPRENFMFLLQEDLRAGFADAMASLARFLEVDDAFAFTSEHRNYPTRPRHILLYRMFERLRGPFLFKKHLKQVLPARLRAGMRAAARTASTLTVEYEPMKPETNRTLRARFVQEIQMLETLIGRDLSRWSVV